MSDAPRPNYKPAGEATALLDAVGIEEVLNRVEEGENLSQIARSIGISRRKIGQWIKDQGAWDQCNEARKAAAESYGDQALAVLEGLDPKTLTKAELARAREIAQHKRWLASAVDPDTYGQRQKLDVEVSTNDMTDEQLAAKRKALEEKLANGGSGI